MEPLETAEIGTTGVRVTRFGLGGAPLGGRETPVEEAVAIATVTRALDLGVRYFDMAPLYGFGRSKRRFWSRSRQDTA